MKITTKALNRFAKMKSIALSALAVAALASTPALAGNNGEEEFKLVELPELVGPARGYAPHGSTTGSFREGWVRLDSVKEAEGNLLENPTFREMNQVWVRYSEKLSLRFSKTILDSFFSFFFFDTSIENLTPKGKVQTNADSICPSVDPGAESGNAAGRAQHGRGASASSLINSAACKSSSRG
jgi:hypothetical protein